MNNRSAIFSRRCWIEGELQPATIVIESGKIVAIEKHHIHGAEDFGNSIIMPGVIDAHVHINEPGRTDWEGFETATQAAAAGGTTTIVDMPLNALPVTTTVNAFQQKINSSKDQLHVNVGFYGGLIPGNIDDLDALLQTGILGVKCFLTHSGIDEFPNVTKPDLEKAMPIIAKRNLPLLVHAEISDDKLPQPEKQIPSSYQQYLESRPDSWEYSAIEMMVELCEKYNCPTHIVHVSSAESLNIIADAKSKGLKLSAETCPQYILFSSEKIEDGNTLFKCAPPIRNFENNKLLKTALKNHVLDFITTDHSPAPPDIKEIQSGNLQKAWGGIAGLQFLLSAGFSALKEEMSLNSFIPLVTERPAKFLQIENSKGFLKIGFDADITIWSPEKNQIINQDQILHKHKATPYYNLSLTGVVEQTIVNGITVYKNNSIIHKNAGKWLLKK